MFMDVFMMIIMMIIGRFWMILNGYKLVIILSKNIRCDMLWLMWWNSLLWDFNGWKHVCMNMDDDCMHRSDVIWSLLSLWGLIKNGMINEMLIMWNDGKNRDFMEWDFTCKQVVFIYVIFMHLGYVGNM